MKSKFLGPVALAGVLLAGTALADPISIVGTWSGSRQGLDPTVYTGLENFVVQTEGSDGSIGGYFSWLSGPFGRCLSFPCQTAFTGSVDTNDTMTLVSVDGTYGATYQATLSDDGNTLSGTFSGTTQNPETGTWTVTRVPEPATLGLMGLGLFGAGFAGRKRRR